jgi:hypothetical protein
VTGLGFARRWRPGPRPGMPSVVFPQGRPARWRWPRVALACAAAAVALLWLWWLAAAAPAPPPGPVAWWSASGEPAAAPTRAGAARAPSAAPAWTSEAPDSLSLGVLEPQAAPQSGAPALEAPAELAPTPRPRPAPAAPRVERRPASQPPAAARPAPAPEADAAPLADRSESSLPGRLSVSSRPWGRLYVDGRFVGNTPLLNAPLSPGDHRIRIIHQGFQPYDTTITVTPQLVVRLAGITLRAIPCSAPPC